MSKLRVLCLHGVYNNIEVMKHQFAYYEYLFSDFIEFDYLQAPHECDEVYDPKIAEKFDGPFYRWIKYDAKNDLWHGHIESAMIIKDHFENNGHYDGIIAFSQGGYMTRTMLKAVECGLPDLQINPGFVVLIGSPIPHDNVFGDLNAGDYKCPVLYIFGEHDEIANAQKRAICPRGDTTTIIHEKGHVMPKFTGEHMDTFINFFNRFYEEKFDKPMTFDFSIDEEFKQNFIENNKKGILKNSSLHKI
ncbi:unnamed protein product [Moneuplotes crassus]|uniref:Serine hydrolase domain-containing protein n=1 Tax=Euplotes crassus TaxID=5936 RepID=A0AAD1XSN1_EUPCR|nr:unnamed protein product [Moneuplotes crassus]